MEINRYRLKKKEGYEYRYGTEDTVAVYYNEKGNKVFNIVETKDGYTSTMCIQGINQLSIPYAEAYNMCSEEERNLPTNEWKTAVINHVCEAFENNYRDQVQRLEELL